MPLEEDKPLATGESFTDRGFKLIQFRDLFNAKCSVQESSLGSTHAIWLGIDDPDPQILASQTKQGGTGWIPYPIPANVQLNTRMHLSKKQVKELLTVLQRFVDTGEI